METNENKVRVSFLAINPTTETHIVLPTERRSGAADRIDWGEGDAYPDYLLDLRNNVSTLASIINGSVDFIAGDDMAITPLPSDAEGAGRMNLKGETIRGQVRAVALDYMTYGGFALQAVRSYTGQVVEIYYLDMRFVRSNKDNSVFYYCEDWRKTRRKVLEYPAFRHFTPEEWAALTPEERDRNASSILFVKDNHTQVYPRPVYAAAVKACESERCIDDYHLNEINNGFAGSMVVNFNNGVPADEIKAEIERDFNAKFAGHQNAGRLIFSWNDSAETATTITEPRVLNFGDKYQALAKHTRQQIFTAFRANPNLFGIPTESLGFSQEEYESVFRLYNRTCVKPIQRLICDAYDRIYGATGVLNITPFSLQETARERNVN